jgi:hypothetical protein
MRLGTFPMMDYYPILARTPSLWVTRRTLLLVVLLAAVLALSLQSTFVAAITPRILGVARSSDPQIDSLAAFTVRKCRSAR